MASWITKIKVKRHFKKIKKFLDETKDYDIKKILLMNEEKVGYNPAFNGLSYIHMHCEDGTLDTKDFYMTMTRETERQLWGIALTLAIGFGFTME